jgi:hypothetical protein
MVEWISRGCHILATDSLMSSDVAPTSTIALISAANTSKRLNPYVWRTLGGRAPIVRAIAARTRAPTSPKLCTESAIYVGVFFESPQSPVQRGAFDLGVG